MADIELESLRNLVKMYMNKYGVTRTEAKIILRQDLRDSCP